MDTRARTLVKSLLWTAIGVVVMAAVGFAATGSLALGGGMAAANAVLGFLTYLVYERVWAGIRWGRDA